MCKNIKPIDFNDNNTKEYNISNDVKLVNKVFEANLTNIKKLLQDNYEVELIKDDCGYNKLCITKEGYCAYQEITFSQIHSECNCTNVDEISDVLKKLVQSLD